MPPDSAATGLGSFFWLFTSVPMVTLPPMTLANPPPRNITQHPGFVVPSITLKAILGIEGD